MMVLATIFDGGFAILENREQVVCLVLKTKNVEIKSFDFAEDAYSYCCKQSARRWVDLGQILPLPLPPIDDLIKAGGVYINPFMNKEWVMNYPIFYNGRIFSTVGLFQCAHLFGIDKLAEYIFNYSTQWIHICEVASGHEAKNHAIYEYKVQHMAMGAYLPAPLRIPDDLPENEIFSDEKQVSIMKSKNINIKGLLR